MLYRRIAMFLGAVLFANILVSCATEKEEPPVVETGYYIGDAFAEPPVFKDKDFEGDDFTFLIYNRNVVPYTDKYVNCADSAGEIISDSVMRRNDETSRKYNVNIKFDEVYSPKYEAGSRIHAGQTDFDVIYESGVGLSSLALEGSLYNFNDVPNIDLERDYWVPSAKNDLNINGKTYIATNYITMNSLEWAGMIYFNNSIYKDLGYEDSMYDLVTSGTWTIDKYVEIALSAVNDINGDATMTASDRYGIWGSYSDFFESLARSSGIRNTVKNDDGSYSIGVYNQRLISIYTSFHEKLDNNDVYITYEDIWREGPNLTDYTTRAEGARFLGFGQSHVLFMPGTLSLSMEFKDMKDEFGILPNPRYNTAQKEFYHFTDCDSPMFALPAGDDDKSNAGTILEYMAYLSAQTVLPEYEKNVTEACSASDSMDGLMFDIIKNSIRYEWTEMYELEVTNSLVRKMMSTGNFNSVFNKLQSKAKQEIDGIVDTFAFIGLKDAESFATTSPYITE